MYRNTAFILFMVMFGALAIVGATASPIAAPGSIIPDLQDGPLIAQAQSSSGASTATTGSNAQSRFHFIDINQFVQRMEADRRLLAEVRKDVPDSKAEAENYLNNLKALAAKSDPVRLVPLVNRVLAQAPTYFDWLDKKFSSDSERAQAYYVGGAQGFAFAMDSFKSAVLLTVINRLDMAAHLIDELDSSQAQ